MTIKLTTSIPTPKIFILCKFNPILLNKSNDIPNAKNIPYAVNKTTLPIFRLLIISVLYPDSVT